MELGHGLNLEEIIINELGKEAKDKMKAENVYVGDRKGVEACGLVFLADEFMPPLIEVICGI